MAILETITLAEARATLATLCDRVAETREPVVIRRRGAQDVALISAEELASLMETAHLLRSPANARRLLKAFTRAQDQEVPASTLAGLRNQPDIEEA